LLAYIVDSDSRYGEKNKTYSQQQINFCFFHSMTLLKFIGTVKNFPQTRLTVPDKAPGLRLIFNKILYITLLPPQIGVNLPFPTTLE
jgi:hypothetical protein